MYVIWRNSGMYGLAGIVLLCTVSNYGEWLYITVSMMPIKRVYIYVSRILVYIYRFIVYNHVYE